MRVLIEDLQSLANSDEKNTPAKPEQLDMKEFLESVSTVTRPLADRIDRFYRTDEARSAETGGAGLGLSITKGIIENHGGEITVKSKQGEGTCFTIILPIKT